MEIQCALVCEDCFTEMLPSATILRQRVASLNRLSDPPECLLANGSKVTLAALIAAHIVPGDDVSFPLPNSSTATAEILVTKNSLSRSGRDVYQAHFGYVTQPKQDKRHEFFVAAEVSPADLGISSIFLACKTLREYFYRIPEVNEPGLVREEWPSRLQQLWSSL